MEKIYNVLFLCTGNSARSIMAEAMLNTMGKGRFRAYSAGSHPAGAVHPLAIEQIAGYGYPVDALRSKSWDEFGAAGAPHMDFVITVCDKAAGEVCPVWPGQPMTAHWGFEDPAAATGSDEEKRQAFRKVCRELKTRLDIFLCLPLPRLEKLALKRELDRIGKLGSSENAVAGDRALNVLFVCTANSARSIMAEALVNILGRGRFKAFSAGSQPGGAVNSFALEQIKALDFDYPLDAIRSKSWTEYARPEAPAMDCIITVCDKAAGEVCQYWPGHQVIAHWGFEDPASLQGTEEEMRARFNKIFRLIMQRVDRLVTLPVETLDANQLRHEIQSIAQTHE